MINIKRTLELFAGLTLVVACPGYTQTDQLPLQADTAVEMSNTASASVIGEQMPKGAELNFFHINEFKITSESKKEGLNDAESEVGRFRRYEFKFKVPAVLKARTKLIVGLSYVKEEYEFKNEDNLTYPLYRNLEEKPLRSVGLDLYFGRSISKNRFILGKFGMDLNGDFTDAGLPFSRFFKYSLAGLIGWKRNPRTSYGVGLYLSYTFGRPRVYPGFMWNKTFNEKWGVEALLPAKMMIRYNFSEKSILLGGFDLNGQSYHLIVDNPPLSDIKTLELRRSDILLKLTYEREIYDFLWFSAGVGYRINHNFYLSENNDFSNAAILDNTIQNKPYLNLSLFLVPPEKLMNKHKRK